MKLTDATVRAQAAAQVFGSASYHTDLIDFHSTTAQKYKQGVPTGFFQTFLNRNADPAGLAAVQAQLKAARPTCSDAVDHRFRRVLREPVGYLMPSLRTRWTRSPW